MSNVIVPMTRFELGITTAVTQWLDHLQGLLGGNVPDITRNVFPGGGTRSLWFLPFWPASLRGLGWGTSCTDGPGLVRELTVYGGWVVVTGVTIGWSPQQGHVGCAAEGLMATPLGNGTIFSSLRGWISGFHAAPTFLGWLLPPPSKFHSPGKPWHRERPSNLNITNKEK